MAGPDSKTHHRTNVLPPRSMLPGPRQSEQNVEVEPCGSITIRNCEHSILNLSLISGNLSSIRYNQQGGKEYYKPRLEASAGHFGDVVGSHESREKLQRSWSAAALTYSDRQTIRGPTIGYSQSVSQTTGGESFSDRTSSVRSESQVTVFVRDIADDQRTFLSEASDTGTVTKSAPFEEDEMTIQENPDQCVVYAPVYSDHVAGIPVAPEWRVWEKSQYGRGKMFKIFDEKNRVIHDRVMVALAHTRHSSIICLALCEHGDLDLDDEHFWETHMIVNNNGLHEPKVKKPDMSQYDLLPLEISKHWKLRSGTCLNLEHIYTIKISDVKVAFCGRIYSKSHVDAMMNAHYTTYEKMLRRGFKANGPSAPAATPATGETQSEWA